MGFGSPYGSSSILGGSVKAAGLGDGSLVRRETIAKLRLTMPPGMD
jgi:hypothetical protein